MGDEIAEPGTCSTKKRESGVVLLGSHLFFFAPSPLVGEGRGEGYILITLT